MFLSKVWKRQYCNENFEEEMLKNLFNIRKGRKTQIRSENLHWRRKWETTPVFLLRRNQKRKSLKDSSELPTRIQSSPRFGGQDSQVLVSIKITKRSFFGTSILRFHLSLLNPLLLHHLVHIRPWNANTRDIGMVCLWLFVTLWTITHQSPLSMGLSKQEYWSGFPFPSPGDLPDPGIKPGSPALQAYSLLCKPPQKPPKTYSVQFSRSVVSDSLRPHEAEHARPPCPSSTPGVHSNSRPSSQWCHPAISSSVIPFSSRPQSLP